MYSIRLEGDTRRMLRKLQQLSDLDKKGVNAALAEAMRDSTLERFHPGGDHRREDPRQVGPAPKLYQVLVG